MEGKIITRFTGVLGTYEKIGGERKTVSKGLLHS